MVGLANSRHLLLAITFASYVLILSLAKIVGLKVDLGEDSSSILYIVTIGACISFIAARWQMFELRAIVECVCCGVLLIVPVTLSTYLAMYANLPLADAQLAAWDRSLGVDWVALVRWIDASSILSEILKQAYQTFSYQLVIWPIVLVVFKRSNRAYQMVSGYAVLCFIASAISVLWPAVGNYPYYQFDPGSLVNIDDTYGYYFLEQFHAVRENPDFVWKLGESAGILTFPSVHAAVAALCAWGVWTIRPLRYPVLLLNIAMAFSTIPAGSHYIVDIMMGCAVAFFAIYVVVVITRQKSHSEPNQITLAHVEAS